MIDSLKLKANFPTLRRKINGHPLVYLDSAATSQRPVQVIQAMNEYYENYNANVHRGIYTISEEATNKYEGAREKIAKFINAKPHEIIFTKNATEALNLIAYAYGDYNINENDSVLLTQMEHHSNIVPWQLLAKRRKNKLLYAMVDDDGFLDMLEFDAHLQNRPKIAAFTNVSNVLGTINPVKEMVKKVRDADAISVVDGAQAVPHMKVNVKEMDCDFYAFSAHKMLGPTGVGVLYAKEGLLQKMEPFLGGGDMIKEVDYEQSRWNDLPWKFEAGTPNVAGVIGFGAAIDYLNKLGMESAREHEIGITDYALNRLNEFEDMTVYGPRDAKLKGGVAAFFMKGVHPHDAASLLDQQGVAVRAGHHCAHLLMKKFNVPATLRASFYVYNSKEDVEKFVGALKMVESVLKK